MLLELESGPNQIQRILQSKAFRTSEVHRNLLNYLAQKSLAGTADALKEYTVGLDVFAKPSSYDPRQESVVRMHMARLRQKLAEYYRTEGAQDEIVVDLPKGGFKLTFEPRPVAPPLAVETPPEPLPALFRPHRLEYVLGALLVLVAGLALYFGARVWRAERTPSTAAAWTPELQQLWRPLLSSNRPLVVCLATPHGGDASPERGLTSLGTANGAFLLGQFLAPHKQRVVLTRSDQLSAPEMAMGDVVFLGPMNGTRGLQTSTAERAFVMEQDGIRNLHPRAGEPALAADHVPQGAQDIEESYALISYLPGFPGSGEILYLSGNQVSSVTAGVQAFTDPTLARTLVSKMKGPDGTLPRYYQVVLKVRSMDGMPLEISYVMHREVVRNP